MCLTATLRLFSWGCGQHGRLGHGKDEDKLEPTEISRFQTVKIVAFSCGESHSAAVTKNLKLYTWGNGVYGRLGNGFDTNLY